MVHDLRVQVPPEAKIGWYLRYMPKDDLDGYNDYRLSLKKKIMGEEAKQEVADEAQPAQAAGETEVDVALDNLFNC